MPFLHLLVSASASGEDDYELVVFDLSADQLHSRFGAHWKRGDAVQHGRVWRAADIKRILVVSTDESADHNLDRLRAESNRQLDALADQGILFPLAPRDSDIVQCGTDVTETYFPPGSLRETAPVPRPTFSAWHRQVLVYVALPLLVTILGGIALLHYERSTATAPTPAEGTGVGRIKPPAPLTASDPMVPSQPIAAPAPTIAATDSAKQRADTTRRQ